MRKDGCGTSQIPRTALTMVAANRSTQATGSSRVWIDSAAELRHGEGADCRPEAAHITVPLLVVVRSIL
ncbi:hypothetical protein BJF84_24035 [Rhodococcus sp. CUA-806]|nr:hypothetical protein BJF84_24035 [Rhodococcus sp. CUA-806]